MITMGKMTAENNKPTNTNTTLRDRSRFMTPSFFKTEWSASRLQATTDQYHCHHQCHGDERSNEIGQYIRHPAIACAGRAFFQLDQDT
jgi:hypothetical protein